MPPLKQNDLNNLAQNILRDIKDSGEYLLQLADNVTAFFMDMLHPVIRFNVPMNFNNLNALIENFHVTDILIDERIDFGADNIKFFENSGVTLKKF